MKIKKTHEKQFIRDNQKLKNRNQGQQFIQHEETFKKQFIGDGNKFSKKRDEKKLRINLTVTEKLRKIKEK